MRTSRWVSGSDGFEDVGVDVVDDLVVCEAREDMPMKY